MEEAAEKTAEESKMTVDELLQQHAEAFGNFYEGVRASILGAASEKSVGPQGFVENFQGRCPLRWTQTVDLPNILCYHSLSMLYGPEHYVFSPLVWFLDGYGALCSPLYLMSRASHRRLHGCGHLPTDQYPMRMRLRGNGITLVCRFISS